MTHAEHARKLRQFVRAGIQWLDTHRAGWRQKINARQLDIGSCDRCVIGQLDGFYHYVGEAGDVTLRADSSYGDGVVTVWWMIEHGFTSTSDAIFDDLTWTWRQELAKLGITGSVREVTPMR